MTVIACVDDRLGLSFNGRRLSRDRVVSEHILKDAMGSRLFCRPQTAKLLEQVTNDGSQTPIIPSGWGDMGPDDFYFLENAEDFPILERASRVILYRWNRTYPYDQAFPLDGWERKETEEFPGNSHEKITKELYCRK